MPPRSPFFIVPTQGLSRRRFVQGLAAGGVLAGLSTPAFKAFAQQGSATRGAAPVLKGTEFDLVIAESPVNFTGKPGVATTINGSLPAPTLRWREGDTVTIRVTNKLREATSIHWHGIILPYQMDGVPGISFNGIAPGETFTYRFKVQQSGSYWYHSHSGFQELTGMYGAIIIDPAGAETIHADRDHVLLFSDWTDEDPMRVFTKLKSQSDYYNYNQPTVFDFFRDASREGTAAAIDKRKMWNEMRMNPTDLADLSAATLTYLANGVTPAGNWTALFRPGERVRLRMVNGAGNTFYDVRIPGLKLTVVHVDGVDVEPVTVDEFRFGPGETVDVIVQPRDDAYTIFAQAMDRTGYARATLAVREGLQAPVPAPRSGRMADHERHDGRHDGGHGPWRVRPGHGDDRDDGHDGHDRDDRDGLGFDVRDGSWGDGRHESRRHEPRWHGDGSQPTRRGGGDWPCPALLLATLAPSMVPARTCALTWRAPTSMTPASDCATTVGAC